MKRRRRHQQGDRKRYGTESGQVADLCRIRQFGEGFGERRDKLEPEQGLPAWDDHARLSQKLLDLRLSSVGVSRSIGGSVLRVLVLIRKPQP